MNIILTTIWILAANLAALWWYPKVNTYWDATLYWLVGNAIVLGWAYGALTKAPLTMVGTVFGAGFPLLCLLVGWASGEALSPAKLSVLLVACGLVAVAAFMK